VSEPNTHCNMEQGSWADTLMLREGEDRGETCKPQYSVSHMCGSSLKID